MSLRVSYVVLDEAMEGVRFLGCHLGETISIHSMSKVGAFDALRRRFERSATDRASEKYIAGGQRKRFRWPESYRFLCPRRFWQVTIADEARREQRCLLEVASQARDRTHSHVQLDVDDARDVASYANMFNLRVLTQGKKNVPMCSKLKVAMPVGCEVLRSSMSEFIGEGDAVVLWPYPFNKVTKFVYDGSEDFLEVPQAFFHFSYFISGGTELMCDLQGAKEVCGDLVIVEPCVLRCCTPSPTTVGSVLKTLMNTGTIASETGDEHLDQDTSATASSEWFDTLHTRCGLLCKSFDPNRRQDVMRRLADCQVLRNRPYCGC